MSREVALSPILNPAQSLRYIAAHTTSKKLMFIMGVKLASLAMGMNLMQPA